MDSYLIDDIPEYISFDIGTKHLAYCLLYNETTYEFAMFDISAKSPKDRILNLYMALNTLTLPRKVVIEQQVANNEIAMTLQTAIEMYYLTHDISIRDITIYNPKDKFKYQGYKSFKGKEHKQLSISYARNIMEKTNINRLSEFEAYKKKDDIADCICMAVFSYIKDHNSEPKDKILKLLSN